MSLEADENEDIFAKFREKSLSNPVPAVFRTSEITFPPPPIPPPSEEELRRREQVHKEEEERRKYEHRDQWSMYVNIFVLF